MGKENLMIPKKEAAESTSRSLQISFLNLLTFLKIIVNCLFELVFLSHLYLNEAQELALVPVITCWLCLKPFCKISSLGSQIGWFFLGYCFMLDLP